MLGGLAIFAVTSGSPAALDQARGGGDLKQAAAGFHELFLHDECTADYPPQPDTCLHKQLLEKPFTFGGKPGTVYDVKLRIRGIFEPTTIKGGETALPAYPYYQVGGAIGARDWSAWHIEVSEPKQTYWLNHYQKVSHTIYNEDFEATIPVAGGASVVVRVVDGNDGPPGPSAGHQGRDRQAARGPDAAHRRPGRDREVAQSKFRSVSSPST
jgi:hypothetical protein